MLRYINSKKMGRGKHGWLDSHFHFSFAKYFNSNNLNFGILRVVNDDIVQPGRGFDTHPHKDMEILSYVVNGELTHADSMGNERKLTRGEVQYMSAGEGVQHSEYNHGETELRFLQIWIYPDKKGYKPQYKDHRFPLEARYNEWLPLASGTGVIDGQMPIILHADANVYVSMIDKGNKQAFSVGRGRQAYLVLIEGEAQIDVYHLHERDALEMTEQNIVIDALETAHVLVIEMAKE